MLSKRQSSLYSCKENFDSKSNLSAKTKNVKFIIGVDIGTTNIRSHVYNSKTTIVGKAEKQLELIYPDENKLEMDPKHLWTNFQEVVKDSLNDAALCASCISGIGISTQRGTFITWDRDTGEPFHNFISWKDKRADQLCKEWNTSLKMKMIRCATYFLYMLTGNKRYKAGSMLMLSSALVLMRLYWVLKNLPEVREKCSENKVLFGTTETWLVWKLTGGLVHSTDCSNASVTGLFDSFQLDWAQWALHLFEIPKNILPSIKYTSDCYGKTMPEIFDFPIPITAVVGDVQASVFGQQCFNVGDVNLTLGTGSFLAINTGSSPCVSNKGAYPTVGWTCNGKTTYLLECGTSDTGTIITWGQTLGFYKEPQESSQVAFSVKDTGGIYFLPASNKLHSTISNFSITGAFIGLRPQTTKAQLTRSMLEALCFQVYLLFKAVTENSNLIIKKFSVCGGVSNNDFVVQAITNLASVPVTRSEHCDASSLGAALLAGLSSDVFIDFEEISALFKKEEIFLPESVATKVYHCLMKKWEYALSYCHKFK